MELVIIWLAFAIVTALAASARGRSGILWFIVGLFFGIFALIAVLVIGRAEGGKAPAAPVGAGGPMSRMGPDGPVVANHKGVLIYQHNSMFWAMGLSFPTINDAKSYIETNVS
jgi:hypothetical protein